MDTTHTLHLLDAGRGGDAAALDALFARERPRLERLLQGRAGPLLLRSTELEDLVQEACCEAMRQLPRFAYQGKDSFFRWLATLALHRLQNLRRVALADKRDPRRERRFAAADSEIGHSRVGEPDERAPGPRTLAASDEGVHRVLDALRHLSDDDRQVITLAKIEGLSLTEIAARIGRTRNAAALLLSRALRKLREQLG